MSAYLIPPPAPIPALIRPDAARRLAAQFRGTVAELPPGRPPRGEDEPPTTRVRGAEHAEHVARLTTLLFARAYLRRLRDEARRGGGR